MKYLKTMITAGLVPALLVSCQPSAEVTVVDDGPTVAAVNYPLAFFAERLAGDFATVIFDAPADEDPAFWQPDDGEIARMQQADVILVNGAGYAKWAATASLPADTVVDTSASFQARYIEVEQSVAHAHGKDGDAHSHGGTAFTTWMDLQLAVAQLDAVGEALAKAFPEHGESIEANRTALRAELADLHEAMLAATAKLRGAPVIASHPVYQYWERAYQLKVPSLMWEPEMELGEEELADLRKVMEANPGAKFFAWEGEPLPDLVAKVKEAGLTSLVVSPCGNRPEGGDFLGVMRDNIAAIEAVTE